MISSTPHTRDRIQMAVGIQNANLDYSRVIVRRRDSLKGLFRGRCKDCGGPGYENIKPQLDPVMPLQWIRF
jgi:hypothetical protein